MPTSRNAPRPGVLDGAEAGVPAQRAESETNEPETGTALTDEPEGARVRRLAHDLNNLVGAITNYAAALTHHRELPPSLQPDLARIAAAAASAADLTRQMLQPGGRERSGAVLVDLAELIGPVVATVAGGLTPTVALHTDLEPDLRVAVDPDELTRLVLNVLVNAIESLPGPGRVTVMARPVDTASGAWVRLTVQDTGVGMTPEVAQRALEGSFSTKIGTRTRGLGLTGASAVMERMGGTIEVHSQPGSGTTVTMVLPRRIAASVD